MHYLYVIKNLKDSNKYYIGMTTDPKARLQQHMTRGEGYIGRAIQKHGSENFSMSVIAQSEDIRTIQTMEIKMIELYRDMGFHLYNQSLGGECGARGNPNMIPFNKEWFKLGTSAIQTYFKIATDTDSQFIDGGVYFKSSNLEKYGYSRNSSYNYIKVLKSCGAIERINNEGLYFINFDVAMMRIANNHIELIMGEDTGSQEFYFKLLGLYVATRNGMRIEKEKLFSLITHKNNRYTRGLIRNYFSKIAEDLGLEFFEESDFGNRNSYYSFKKKES